MPQRTDRREAKGDAARLLLAAARERFAVAAVDLLLPDQARLNEWQRLTAAALLTQLVRTVESELRSGLADLLPGDEELQAALTSDHVPIALPILERANVLRDADLGVVLVRRVEEHRFHRDHDPRGSEELLQELIADADEAVAGEAMAMLIARSRRFDRFSEPVMSRTELAAELQHRLVWLVAAALRQYCVQQHGVDAVTADEAIAAAAGAIIASYDEGESLEARAMQLAGLLQRSGRLDDDLLARLAGEGNLPLFVAALALRCSVEFPAAWEVLSDPRGRGPALLLRAADVARGPAATILLMLNAHSRLFSGSKSDAAADQLDQYDETDPGAARGTLLLWQVDSGYRAAIARLSTRLRSAVIA